MITNRLQPEEPRSQVRWLATVLGVLLVPTLVLWWPGCRQYPEATSPEAMQLMKLLYAACNARDGKRLLRVEQGIDKLTREKKLTDRERDAFQRIVATARAGAWEDAERASFRFAQDQVR